MSQSVLAVLTQRAQARVIFSLIAMGWSQLAGAEINLASPGVSPKAPEVSQGFAESRFGEPPAAMPPPEYGRKRSLLENELSRTKQGRSGERGLASVADSRDIKLEALSRVGVQEVALIASEKGFYPKAIFVTKNIPVKIFLTGTSKKALCIIFDSFQLRKQLKSLRVEEIEFTPDKSGQFRFYCPINGMEGTLFVKDGSAVARAQELAEQPEQNDGGTEVKPDSQGASRVESKSVSEPVSSVKANSSKSSSPQGGSKTSSNSSSAPNANLVSSTPPQGTPLKGQSNPVGGAKGAGSSASSEQRSSSSGVSKGVNSDQGSQDLRRKLPTVPVEGLPKSPGVKTTDVNPKSYQIEGV